VVERPEPAGRKSGKKTAVLRLGTVDELVVLGLLYTDFLEISPEPCTIVMGVAR
jgi:hypothetical protein